MQLFALYTQSSNINTDTLAYQSPNQIVQTILMQSGINVDVDYYKFNKNIGIEKYIQEILVRV